MPIKFSLKKLPVDESGKAYDSFESFQISMLLKLIPDVAVPAGESPAELICRTIVMHRPEVLEILQINENSLPAARGQKRPRKPKTVPDAEDTTKAA